MITSIRTPTNKHYRASNIYASIGVNWEWELRSGVYVPVDRLTSELLDMVAEGLAPHNNEEEKPT
jgi:hypothetical protein